MAQADELPTFRSRFVQELENDTFGFLGARAVRDWRLVDPELLVPCHAPRGRIDHATNLEGHAAWAREHVALITDKVWLGGAAIYPVLEDRVRGLASVGARDLRRASKRPVEAVSGEVTKTLVTRLCVCVQPRAVRRRCEDPDVDKAATWGGEDQSGRGFRGRLRTPLD